MKISVNFFEFNTLIFENLRRILNLMLWGFEILVHFLNLNAFLNL